VPPEPVTTLIPLEPTLAPLVAPVDPVALPLVTAVDEDAHARSNDVPEMRARRNKVSL
jgi:hypothetical protein